MTDYCRVTVVGNLGQEIVQFSPPGEPRESVGISSICVAQTRLERGEVTHQTTVIPIEIGGAARASRAAQLFGAGSRVVIDGHLELRGVESEERLRTADGRGDALVIVPRPVLVLVVDALLNADLPSPASDVQRHAAAQIWPGSV